MKFGSSIGIFLSSANLICRSTDISKCLRGSLRLRDDESRLNLKIVRSIFLSNLKKKGSFKVSVSFRSFKPDWAQGMDVLPDWAQRIIVCPTEKQVKVKMVK